MKYLRENRLAVVNGNQGINMALKFQAWETGSGEAIAIKLLMT